jgi:hypothetical protein
MHRDGFTVRAPGMCPGSVALLTWTSASSLSKVHSWNDKIELKNVLLGKNQLLVFLRKIVDVTCWRCVHKFYVSISS